MYLYIECFVPLLTCHVFIKSNNNVFHIMKHHFTFYSINLKSTILLLVVILRLLRLEFIHLELIMSARVLIVPIFYLML